MPAAADSSHSVGNVRWRLYGPGGNLLGEGAAHNLITQVGDQVKGERFAGVAGALAAPTGMKLGTGAVTGGSVPAKTGSGAALTTFAPSTQLAFDSTWPKSTLNGAARRITFQCTWAPGVGTTATALTEAVIVNDASLTNATSTAANTVARVALSPVVPQKGALDTLIITWTSDDQGV